MKDKKKGPRNGAPYYILSPHTQGEGLYGYL